VSGDVDAALEELFGGARPLRMEEAVFEASLLGWRRQQVGAPSRRADKRDRVMLVRRFQVELGLWPWEWQAVHVDEWLEDMGGPPRRRAVSTLRRYQGTLRGFLGYLTDERYPWAAICQSEFGRRPVQVIDERNSITHLADDEGAPGRRPMTREELTLFFDHCDARVHSRQALRRKGSLTAFRDATLFKVIYAWGLRRQEARDAGRLGLRPQSAPVVVRALRHAERAALARRRVEVRRSAVTCRRCSIGRSRSSSNTLMRCGRCTAGRSIRPCG
jgi:hypothetical protein